VNKRDRQIAALIALLDEAVTLLDRNGIDQWATWMRRGAAGLRAGDRSTVDYILQAYGGMGSFTDFWVAGPDGARIDELRAAIYDAARALRVRR
jgi:uncharacterized protein DUF6966